MGKEHTEIVLDFDGTVVVHSYPKIGRDIGAVPILKDLIENGHKLILFTMRSGQELDDAVNWFKENEIELYGIQKNPTQHMWTSSPKAFGDLIIDDAALGCPLVYSENERPYVDWVEVRKYLVKHKIIK